jgi:FkbM family methyltransferase
MPKTIEYLKMTAKYNGNITVVPFGLGDKPSILRFQENANDSGSSMFDDSGELEMNVTTIDDWVEQNNIKKVDFIKSDIEGDERNMLAGAKKVLKTHYPILSICAYHFPDDLQVLEGLILDANPDYNIIHRKMKLFAYVPKRG